MQSAKDAAAAAKSGLEKTKASLQEKGEKMTTRDPLKKDLATDKKEQRKDEAELRKQAEYDRNEAEKLAKQAGTGHHTTTTGTTGLGGTGAGRYDTGSTF
ncbi:hypothetical protein LIER_41230 [Lithospermum erythrorhizon]|uniref:Uncharacterized protein n=1 Tax=Lithospermum erythrorhizon TaxID=34254 RepID=A0AAV3R600_LITER